MRRARAVVASLASPGLARGFRTWAQLTRARAAARATALRAAEGGGDDPAGGGGGPPGGRWTRLRGNLGGIVDLLTLALTRALTPNPTPTPTIPLPLTLTLTLTLTLATTPNQVGSWVTPVKIYTT